MPPGVDCRIRISLDITFIFRIRIYDILSIVEISTFYQYSLPIYVRIGHVPVIEKVIGWLKLT